MNLNTLKLLAGKNNLKNARNEICLTNSQQCSVYSDFKSFINQQSQRNTPGGGKHKHLFIAKKIEAPQQDDSNSKQSILPLIKCKKDSSNQKESQKLKVKDEKNETNNDFFEEDKEIYKRNIFQTQPYADQFQGGPTYTKEGSIIQRSIVGSVEIFEQKNRRQSKLIQKLANINNNVQQKVRVNSILKKQARSSVKSDRSSTTNIQVPQDDTVIYKNKSQLLFEIDAIKRRVQNHKEIEKKVLQTLPLEEKIVFQQQQKCLDAYEKKQNTWFDFMEKSQYQLSRGYSQPLILSGDQYRYKKECTDIFEYNKSDFERYGSKVWLMTLRKGKNEKQPDDMKQELMVIQDIPDAFKNAQFVPHKKSCEIIRRPMLTDLSYKKSPTDSISIYSTKSYNKSFSKKSSYQQSGFMKDDEYYLKRISEVKEDVRRVMPLEEQCVEYDNLAIIGQSQLQRESDAVQQMQINDSYVYKLPNIDVKKAQIIKANNGKNLEKSESSEEVYAQNYDKDKKIVHSIYSRFSDIEKQEHNKFMQSKPIGKLKAKLKQNKILGLMQNNPFKK